MAIMDIQSLLAPPLRIAGADDLKFLFDLEEAAFEGPIRSTRASIRRSISSEHQVVLIIEDDNGAPCGSIGLRLYKHQLRIMSVAVLPNVKGHSYGTVMVEKAIEFGRYLEVTTISLEADNNNHRLLRWYESFGFEKKEVLTDYYGKSRHGVRMLMELIDSSRYLAITDYETDFFDAIPGVMAIRASDYFDEQVYQNTKAFRVFNFCNDYSYQTVGYYVSLLAMARNQVAYPSASLLKDIDNQSVIQSVGEEIDQLVQKSLKDIPDSEVHILSCFGMVEEEKYKGLVKALNTLYHAPLIEYHFIKAREWYLKGIRTVGLDEALKSNLDTKVAAVKYFDSKRFVRTSLKQYEYDMAILIDPDEQLPPSDQAALLRFERAAEAQGFYVDYITKSDYSKIPEFDALFIRTTTNVNDYTYDFARYAYAEGLAVIDDPWSILRCANKIYLYEALKKAKVQMPKTWVINKKGDYKKTVKKLKFPTILKLPDSAFSAGVFKVKNEEECLEKLDAMFIGSELLIAQAYMPTDYDWRIGVLDSKLLYACKYYMAKGHWQIVDWEASGSSFREGAYESIALKDVPSIVSNRALKAAATMGTGLYGVDLKVYNDEVYVIEVNDNPSIEHGVEDGVEGQRLYEKIAKAFYQQLENNTAVLRDIN